MSSVFECVRNGDLKGLTALINEDQKYLNFRDSSGNTLLCLAAKYGHLNIVDYLISQGIDINAVNAEDAPAVVVATLAGQNLIANHLANCNCDLTSYVSEDMHNALIFYTLYGNSYIVQTIITKYKYDINSQSHEGFTALMAAASTDNPGMMKLLIGLGADLNIVNDDGDSALLLAIAQGHISAAKLLIAEKKCNLNVKCHDNDTALMLAVAKKLPEIVELLLKNNVEINTVNKDGVSALQMSVIVQDASIVEMLIKYNANPFLVSMKGQTALMLAENNANDEIYHMLERYTSQYEHPAIKRHETARSEARKLSDLTDYGELLELDDVSVGVESVKSKGKPGKSEGFPVSTSVSKPTSVKSSSQANSVASSGQFERSTIPRQETTTFLDIYSSGSSVIMPNERSDPPTLRREVSDGLLDFVTVNQLRTAVEDIQRHQSQTLEQHSLSMKDQLKDMERNFENSLNVFMRSMSKIVRDSNEIIDLRVKYEDALNRIRFLENTLRNWQSNVRDPNLQFDDERGWVRNNASANTLNAWESQFSGNGYRPQEIPRENPGNGHRPQPTATESPPKTKNLGVGEVYSSPQRKELLSMIAKQEHQDEFDFSTGAHENKVSLHRRKSVYYRKGLSKGESGNAGYSPPKAVNDTVTTVTISAGKKRSTSPPAKGEKLQGYYYRSTNVQKANIHSAHPPTTRNAPQPRSYSPRSFEYDTYLASELPYEDPHSSPQEHPRVSHVPFQPNVHVAPIPESAHVLKSTEADSIRRRQSIQVRTEAPAILDPLKDSLESRIQNQMKF